MLPEGFILRMQSLLGEEYAAFSASFDRPLCTGLRLNPLKTGFTGDLSRFSLSPVPWCPTGYVYDAASRPGLSPYHAAGLYYLQEPSAMAPAELLDPQPGERVLDLCAAPGGKSTQLAGKLQGRGLLVCNEINAKRAKILAGNIERMGIANALVLSEHPARLAERFAGFFDRILVDAPCSGEGMFRKNEDACDEWSPENVENCAARQAEILDCAAEMLKPGGRLVYSTCTFAPAENEGSISRFLERHPEFELLPDVQPTYDSLFCYVHNLLRQCKHLVVQTQHYESAFLGACFSAQCIRGQRASQSDPRRGPLSWMYHSSEYETHPP